MLTYCKRCVMPSTKPDLHLDDEGKGYKFTAENVALLLQAAMKDVSPNR
jgi:hypothetical protein